MSARLDEQESGAPIPDDLVDWFVAFLRRGEGSNGSQA